MAKTFNPNRVGGGTVSIVRAADGTYSLKEEGFQAVTSLNMVDLGEVAKTTTPTKTETATEKTETTTADQTKAAFMLPKGRDKDDQFTTENMLQSAKDVSKSLQGVTTPTTIQDSMQRSVTGVKGPPSVISGPQITSPTENVFGTADDPVANRSQNLSLKEPDVSVPTAKERTKKPRIRNIKDLQGGKSEVTKAAEGRIKTIDEVAKENIARQEEARQAVTADQGFVEQTDSALGVTAPTGIKGPPSQISGPQVEMKPEVKKTFAETATTALKSVGVAISNMPSVQIMKALAVPRGESAGAVALNKTYFTDRGDGRIGGNPATDLYAGMNRVSAFGNLENAGAKRLAKRRETIAKRAASGNPVSQKFIDDTNKMDKQQDDYKAAKKSAPVTGTTKPGQAGGSEAKGSPKIVCTMMNESYGFGSFRNKIWLRHSKNLAPEYQIGYHRIFLPLVKKAKTNKILKKILEHIAVHRTIDIRQQERNKIHLIGRVYRTILEPICYWAGKK